VRGNAPAVVRAT